MRMRSFLPVLICMMGLSSCTAYLPPAARSASVYPGETYSVGTRENIYSVAKKNKVRMSDIIALNKLESPYLLKPGQRIVLPAKDGFAAPIPQSAPLDYIDKGYMSPAQTTPSYSAGGGAGVEPVSSTPLSTNNLSGSAAVSSTPLEPIVLDKPAAPTAPLATASPMTTSSPASSPLSLNPATEGTASLAQPLPEAQSEPTGGSENVSTATPSFGWPIRGTIISTYGPKGKGRDNDGINIGAPKGSPVKAAESGIVVYAGSDMKGFGNLILIRHEGGWVTAYAHMERLVVARDAVVAKGDMIGTVGSTGGVSSPQLHFEARRDGAPVDPELVIK